MKSGASPCSFPPSSPGHRPHPSSRYASVILPAAALKSCAESRYRPSLVSHYVLSQHNFDGANDVGNGAYDTARTERAQAASSQFEFVHVTASGTAASPIKTNQPNQTSDTSVCFLRINQRCLKSCLPRLELFQLPGRSGDFLLHPAQFCLVLHVGQIAGAKFRCNVGFQLAPQ